MTKIYVGNLSYRASEQDVRSAFERFGDVSSVRLITDQSTGRSRGFAFVSMPRLDDADEAITRLNGAPIGDRNVVVNEARSDDDAPRRSPAHDRWQLI